MCLLALLKCSTVCDAAHEVVTPAAPTRWQRGTDTRAVSQTVLNSDIEQNTFISENNMQRLEQIRDFYTLLRMWCLRTDGDEAVRDGHPVEGTWGHALGRRMSCWARCMPSCPVAATCLVAC